MYKQDAKKLSNRVNIFINIQTGKTGSRKRQTGRKCVSVAAALGAEQGL